MELTKWDFNTPIADMCVNDIDAAFTKTRTNIAGNANRHVRDVRVLMGIYVSPDIHVDVAIMGGGNREIRLMGELTAWFKGVEHAAHHATVWGVDPQPRFDRQQADHTHGWDVVSIFRNADDMPTRENVATFPTKGAAEAFIYAAETTATVIADNVKVA